MSKSQNGNKEAKKPKRIAPPVPAGPPVSGKPVMATLPGANLRKR
jgi:hypothetical protein